MAFQALLYHYVTYGTIRHHNETQLNNSLNFLLQRNLRIFQMLCYISNQSIFTSGERRRLFNYGEHTVATAFFTTAAFTAGALVFLQVININGTTDITLVRS